MLIDSYCDSSGKSSDQSGYVLLVGHSAPEDKWRTQFEKQWQDALATFGAKTLHMTDLIAKKGEYEQWPDKTVSAFVNALLKILTDAGLKGVACAVSIHDYKQANLKRNLFSIEQICLYYYLWAIGDFYSTGDLRFIFDQGDKFYHFAKQIEQGPKKQHAVKRGLEIQQVKSNDCPAVQSADLSAWYARRHWMKHPRAFPGDNFVNVVNAVHYHNSKRFELDALLNFDFDRLVQNSLASL